MSPQFNPEMLTLARESRGWTQKQLADALGLTQGLVSKLESGIVEASEDSIERFGHTLNYPAAFFMRSDVIYGQGSNCNYQRKRQSLPVQQLRRILAQINVIRIQLSKLLLGAEIQAANKIDRLDIGEYKDSPEYIALLVRRSWGLPSGPINNLTAAIESAGGVVVPFAFGTNKLDAVSQWVPGMPPVFFVNTEIPGDRLRFTLAHELGHVIMHHIPTANMEHEADQFAAELLAPAAEIRPQLAALTMARVAELKRYWKISMAALIRRAYQLGQITSAQYRRMITQLYKLGYRLMEPVEVARESPTIVQDLIEMYRKTHGYSLKDLCQLVASRESDFRSVYMPLSPKLRVVN